MANKRRLHIHVNGIVQGVGFRPFVYNLAAKYELSGWVCNTSAGVDIEVEGTPEQTDNFEKELRTKPPALAVIQSIETASCPLANDAGFEIRHSKNVSHAIRFVSPDVSICEQCLQELFDPNDRRYRYPFINCTNCGPRFTIIKDLPYDRPFTTMAVFPMCSECEKEYVDPADRRFHAQPVACPECGPAIWLEFSSGNTSAVDTIYRGEDALQKARRLLADGKILAIKGLGGFHLACDAGNDLAVSVLRKRKNRPHKPFALMAYDLETIKQFCHVSNLEADVLASKERPIVLLSKNKSDRSICDEVAPSQNTIGVMLPYTPFHYLLLQPQDGFPLAMVMTSGNLSDEPIVVSNREAAGKLADIADAFLFHDREIYVRCDDSVVRVFGGTESSAKNRSGNTHVPQPGIYPVRRSRGYAPMPLQVAFDCGKQIFASGAELKNTFCLTKGKQAYLSQHLGDLHNYDTLVAYETGIRHFEHLFDIRPDVLVHDLHPGYLSTAYVKKRSAEENLPVIGVQHHRAHIISCMADNGFPEKQPVIGVAFDGTGYGDDGAVWGGEFFVGDYKTLHRAAHLKYFPLPGGDSAVRNPWKTALALLAASGLPWDADLQPVRYADNLPSPVGSRLIVLEKQLSGKLNTLSCSSMGRLFDTVSSLAGVRQHVDYEGQAAIELEAAATAFDGQSYPWEYSERQTETIIDPAPLLAELIRDLREGVAVPELSAKFHLSVAEMVCETARKIRDDRKTSSVFLSGGVWQNRRLLVTTIELLYQAGFDVYIHKNVPPNDGGISFGQTVMAAVRIGGFERKNG